MKQRAEAKPELIHPLLITSHCFTVRNKKFHTVLCECDFKFCRAEKKIQFSCRKSPLHDTIQSVAPYYQIMNNQSAMCFGFNNFSRTVGTNFKWQQQVDKKREKPTCVPLLFSFNSVNCPQVKISCSCQFNSASNDAATWSVFFPPLFPSPFPSHQPLSSISLSVSWIELSCSSNRQHRESLVYLGSLTDGYFTPIIWVLCLCLRRCVCVCTWKRDHAPPSPS